MADKTYKNYIDGKWVESAGGKHFENVNPANGEVLGFFPRSTPADMNSAVEAACKAFDMWRKFPAPKRGEVLFRAAEMLLNRKEDLARQMTEEMGKVLKETRGDVLEAIDMTYYMAGEGRRLFGYNTPSELPNKVAMALRVPVGVVAAITPWNFPLAIPSWKIMPALMAGNTVVFKPSTHTPLSAYNLVSILEEAGLPPGVLNLVFEQDVETAESLVRHPGVTLVSFTGSTATGNSIAQICASLGKRVSLEMGGKNAIIVMKDADLDLALEGILWSAFGTSGQRCTAASRILVEDGVQEDLKSMMIPRVEKLRLGDGLLPTTDVGPMINEVQMNKVLGYMRIARDEGASILCGGERSRENGLEKGFFVKPTVLGDVRPDMRVAQEEIFGPVTDLLKVESLEEAVAVNNSTQYGLSSAIFTRDINKAFKAIEDIHTGLVYVNAGTIGAEVHLPFGGTRATGNGHREAGLAAMEVFTEWKVVYIDYSGRLQKAQILE